MTKFEEWKAAFEQSPEEFRAKQNESKVFPFDKVILQLQRMQNNMSYWDLEDLFGEQIARHLFEKFVSSSNRNILSWFSSLYNEYRFFIITKLNEGKWK